MKLSYAAKAYSDNSYIKIFFIDLLKGDKFCHRTYLDEVFKRPEMTPRGRHQKFSSIGNDLTADVFKGDTYKTPREINQLVVHCTATPVGRKVSAKDVDNMHINRWGATSGIGYHYLIAQDGTIEKGRWADYSGAHVKGHNSDTLGIAYAGGVDSNLNAVEDRITPKQRESLNELLALLADIYGLRNKDVLGHREFRGVYKACPCLNMDSVRRDINT